MRGVYFRDVEPRGNDITLVGEGVAAVVIAARLALLAVLLYVAMITLVDGPSRRIREVEDLSFVREVERMVSHNKYS